MIKPSKLIKADKMLKFFKTARPGRYKTDQDQVELIKEFWNTLHIYTEAEFSFNDEFTEIIKK